MVIQRHWRNRHQNQPGACCDDFLCFRNCLKIACAECTDAHWASLNFAGTARAHLHKWIEAASMVQRAVRAWLLRRGLERFAAQRRRGVAAVVRLQALWRARGPYRQYQQLRQAAICVQARGRDWDWHGAKQPLSNRAWPLSVTAFS